MEKPKLILFYELCRLCLEKPGMKNMFEAAELVEDIFLCTGVRVRSYLEFIILYTSGNVNQFSHVLYNSIRRLGMA